MLIIKRDLADRWFCLLFSQNCAKTFEIETIQYFVIFHVCEFYLNSVELQSSNNSDYSLDRRFRSFWKIIDKGRVQKKKSMEISILSLTPPP